MGDDQLVEVPREQTFERFPGELPVRKSEPDIERNPRHPEQQCPAQDNLVKIGDRIDNVVDARDRNERFLRIYLDLTGDVIEILRENGRTGTGMERHWRNSSA
jgi:hypothetical protein